MKKYTIFFLLAVLTALYGCGSSNPQGRLEIKGDVTLKGSPVAAGSIVFEPTGSQTERTQSGGEIRDGKYSVPAPKGLVPGEYLVRINVMEEVPGSRVDDPDPMKARVEYRNAAPPEFNTQSTQSVKVEKGKENKFDFAM